jgi:hypothetical protein
MPRKKNSARAERSRGVALIYEAIVALKDRRGSTPKEILAYVHGKYGDRFENFIDARKFQVVVNYGTTKSQKKLVQKRKGGRIDLSPAWHAHVSNQNWLADEKQACIEEGGVERLMTYDVMILRSLLPPGNNNYKKKKEIQHELATLWGLDTTAAPREFWEDAKKGIKPGGLCLRIKDQGTPVEEVRLEVLAQLRATGLMTAGRS